MIASCIVCQQKDIWVNVQYAIQGGTGWGEIIRAGHTLSLSYQSSSSGSRARPDMRRGNAARLVL